jgi:hypothetical protein
VVSRGVAQTDVAEPQLHEQRRRRGARAGCRVAARAPAGAADGGLMAGRRRGRSFATGLLKLLALVALAGGVGAGLGMALVALSGDDELSAPAPGTGTAATAPTPTPTATVPARTTPPAPATPPGAVTTTTTTARPPASAAVQLKVLGAVLRPAGTPSGRRRQRARLIMRIRARNGGATAVTLGAPILRVGRVRIRLDRAGNAPDRPLGTLAAGEAKSVTLRYELSGDVTPKVTRDRRARLEVGGRSMTLRVQVGAPLRSAP